jgi:hypothetical protein
MKLRELIMMEDDGGSAATTSSDIATVAYPLFVRGQSNKAKRKNARAAVGQKYVPGPEGIGTGVFESSLEEIDRRGFLKGMGAAAVAGAIPLGAKAQSPNYPQLANYAVQKADEIVTSYPSVMTGGRRSYFANYTRENVYNSTIWYLNNTNGYNAEQVINYGILSAKRECDALKTGFGDLIGGGGLRDNVGMKVVNTFVQTYNAAITQKYNEVQQQSQQQSQQPHKSAPQEIKLKLKLNRQVGDIILVRGGPADGKKAKITQIFGPNEEGTANKGLGVIIESVEQGMAEGVVEAHALGNDSVIYRLDSENPMSDTEVMVIGGAGRYSLRALRDKARREAAALSQDLGIEHGDAFRRSATNIKQLTNTINTIVAAYNELARIRRKGGRGSRGITDEDTNFIRECIRVVEQATQNYRLLEARAVEPHAQGYAKNNLTSPKYTVVVNTPGDLDWYKIGMYWHDKVVDPHEFGQDDSDTVMVAQGPEDYKQMLAKIKQMGLTYKEIGGTNDQPEIHSKTY